MKYKRLVIVIVVIMLISYLAMGFIPVTSNKAYAAKVPAGTLSRDIEGLDENLYPGYKQLIKNVQSKHGNYTFLLYYTGMNWNEVLVTEYQGHGRSPLNLFQIGTNYNGMWICPICGNKAYDNGSWCCASLEALAYMMDPRASINENDVFQFKDLEGGDVTYNDIARVVANYGSYLNNGEAIQAIVDASNQYNINGYFLVAKIINEHGKNGSTLSNGNGYNGNYRGCYNYFNIGSTGNGSANIINNGLSYAQSHGWTSIRASILGGSAVVKESYITKYSQNTLYYQKFNVSGKSPLASHQYQQNIMAAQSQGTSLKNYYSDLNVNNHVFIIPVYENMPKTVATRPNQGKANTISYEDGVIQNIATSLKVRASANGTAIGALNNGENVKILQRATSQVGGYYWDLIVSEKNGTYGYAARIIGGDTCIASKGSTGSSGGSASTVQPEPTPTPEEPETPAKPKPVKPEKNLETDIVMTEDNVKLLPDITYEDLKTKYENITVEDSKGNEVTSGELGTGYKVTIEEKTYPIVKMGDVNGDGKISILDTVLMINVIKGSTKVENEFKEAACIKGESNFNVTDIVYLINCIKGDAFLQF